MFMVNYWILKVRSVFSGGWLSLFQLATQKRVLQPLILFGSMIMGMGCTFISSILTARGLGTESYGDTKFIQSLWLLLYLLLSLGLFNSSGRLALIEKNSDEVHDLLGTTILIMVVIGAGISSIVLLTASFIDSVFQMKLAKIVIILSPLAIALPVREGLALLLQSIGKIYSLAMLNVLPSLLYLLGVVLASQSKVLSVSMVLCLQQVTVLVVAGAIIISIRPRFHSVRNWCKKILNENRSYGGPVYVGSLAGVASAQVNRIAISYWVDNRAIGFYSLALQLVEPLRFIPSAVSTSSLREFVRQNKVSRKLLWGTFAMSVVSVCVCLVLFGAPLTWLYSKDFAEAGTMARAATLSAILYGFGDFYNRFLGAHGKGNVLRNAALLVGLANAAGFFLLLPFFGAWGGIVTTILAGAVYFGCMLTSYKRHCANMPNLHGQRSEPGEGQDSL